MRVTSQITMFRLFASGYRFCKKTEIDSSIAANVFCYVVCPHFVSFFFFSDVVCFKSASSATATTKAKDQRSPTDTKRASVSVGVYPHVSQC